MISWYIESSCIVIVHPPPSSRAEETLDVLQTFHERVYVGFRGVHGERRACGRRDAVTHAHRPRTVLPYAHRDALLVEHLPHVVRVDVAERGREERGRDRGPT